MKQVEIKREIRRKVLQWQELGAGKWNPVADIKMRAIDKEIDELYKQLEDKNWNWYDAIEE